MNPKPDLGASARTLLCGHHELVLMVRLLRTLGALGLKPIGDAIAKINPGAYVPEAFAPNLES